MEKEKASERPIAQRVTEIGGLRPGTIEITFEQGIAADSIYASLDKIFKLHGCPACGLNGLDLRFRPEDLFRDNFRDIKGIVNVAKVNY